MALTYLRSLISFLALLCVQVHTHTHVYTHTNMQTVLQSPRDPTVALPAPRPLHSTPLPELPAPPLPGQRLSLPQDRVSWVHHLQDTGPPPPQPSSLGQGSVFWGPALSPSLTAVSYSRTRTVSSLCIFRTFLGAQQVWTRMKHG